MALKSSREGLRKELVDYLGNLIVDDNLRNEIVKAVGDKFVTPEVLNENVNNLIMQITTESSERIDADDILQNNITAEVTAREEADTTLQNNINTETIARQEAITNLEGMIATSSLQIDLLWTNASPTSAFAPQSIDLNFSDYDYLIIDFNVVGQASVYDTTPHQIYMCKNEPGNYRVNAVHNMFTTRYFVITSNGFYFNSGGYFGIYGGDTITEDNNLNIPYQIYGVK